MTFDDEFGEGFDKRVGAAIQELRKSRGMTQATLAEEVTARGVAWRQQTVLKVEKGQRPLRLQEADAVARALAVDVDVLTAEKVVFDQTALLISHIRSTEDAWEAFLSGGSRLLEFLGHLRSTLERITRTGHWESMDRSVLNAAATLLQLDIVTEAEGIRAGRNADIERDNAAAEGPGGVFSKTFMVEEWL